MPAPLGQYRYLLGILQGIGANYDNPKSRALVEAWMQEEGTWNPSSNNYVGKINNPFDSTLRLPGSQPFNANNGYPVQIYPNYQEGLQASMDLLNQPHMGAIREAIVEGKPSLFFGSRGQKELARLGYTPSNIKQTNQLYNQDVNPSQQFFANIGNSIGNAASSIGSGVSHIASSVGSGIVSGVKSLGGWLLKIVVLIVIFVLMALILYRGVIAR